MKRVAHGTAIAFLLFLSSSSPASSDDFLLAADITTEAEAVAWAQGRIIDSVYVVGNTKVREIAVLREMELRAGMRFDPIAFERDQRYVGDLSVFSDVVIVVEPVGVDRCRLRVEVRERSTILLKLIYPVLEYDFNSERFKFGLKWSDRNFRKRLESFSADAIRDSQDNDNFAIGWNTRWIGWKRVGVGLRGSYFHRGELVNSKAIIEQGRGLAAVSLPLTESRIRRSDALLSLAYTDNRLSNLDGSVEDEELITPSVGYVWDNRDSPLRPRGGGMFFLNLATNRVLNGNQRNYYGLLNDSRYFLSLNEETTVAFWSRLDYQFGQYPDYIIYRLAGHGTLRGYDANAFSGAHRWVQSVETRVAPFAKQFYKLPFVGTSDFLLTFALFVDTGIVWSNQSEFALSSFHGGFGWGIRLYSPFQDVARFDIAYTLDGRASLYFGTGTRF